MVNKEVLICDGFKLNDFELVLYEASYGILSPVN